MDTLKIAQENSPEIVYKVMTAYRDDDPSLLDEFNVRQLCLMEDIVKNAVQCGILKGMALGVDIAQNIFKS